jgi:hypothetical protein
MKGSDVLKSGSESTQSKIRKVISDIITADTRSYFKDQDRFDYVPERVYANTLMADSQNETVGLPANVWHCVAEFRRIRKEDGHWHTTDLPFLQYSNVVVPLKTHVNAESKEYSVYYLNQTNSGVEKTEPLSNYILAKLPDEVILTRVLSEAETSLFEKGEAGSLGSLRDDSMWSSGTFHTALHNVSSEFLNSENYSRTIEFKLDKDVLKELYDQGLAHFGTYDFLFKERKEDSPFPFEVEIIFKKEALPQIMTAYKKWSEETGQVSIPNPFFSH